MKFKFRLETVLRHRKIEQDVAQREYSLAQHAVRDQLSYIKQLYNSIDMAREKIEGLQTQGGSCSAQINSIDAFIVGQKIVIERARQKARELMQVEEEKHELLVDAMREYKIIERVKEKKKEEFKKLKNKKQQKAIDEIVTMRFKHGVES